MNWSHSFGKELWFCDEIKARVHKKGTERASLNEVYMSYINIIIV